MHLYYTTFSDLESAKKICRILIEEGLIKCANIQSGTSLYEWQDKVEENQEYYAILKSKHHFEAVEGRLNGVHPYDTPCLLEIDLENVSPPYLKWIES